MADAVLRHPHPAAGIRPLAAGDLAAVAAIDRELSGRGRSAYFTRRLEAALRAPDLHVQLAAVEQGTLRGFVLARLLEGEFGRAEAALRLETIGVARAAQEHGVGELLMHALEEAARRRAVRELRTSASWREHAVLRFLDHSGWSLGRNHVFECALAESAWFGPREVPVDAPLAPHDPNDYSASRGNDYETLARDLIDVGVLRAADLQGIVRIDRRLTEHDRSVYLRHALDEALLDSSVRISLAARADGALAGFLMARVDFGDFGRPAPVAVIDTIGVDPMRVGLGFGRALLSQLILNLAALGVERIETVVAPDAWDLLRFFTCAGLHPSERLAFAKHLD
jgi:GNAT superfamily N-acetyltransferase